MNLIDIRQFFAEEIRAVANIQTDALATAFAKVPREHAASEFCRYVALSNPMTWFETLTGFPEESQETVRANITVEGNTLKSRVNGKVFVCGELETPSLADLRERVHSSGHKVGRVSLREVVANVQHLHASGSNAGSLFQVASQFNLLEMASPSVTPEHGVGIYENDRRYPAASSPYFYDSWVDDCDDPP